jgi:hypothetical protein
MIRKLSIGTVAVAIASALAIPGAQSADENAESVRLLRNIAAGQTNQVATVMFAAGVRKCAERIDQITNFLTRGTQASALLFLPEREPDNSMISVSLEVQPEGTPRAYGTITFSPNTAIGCSATYESVQYWPESCNAVAAKHFKGATSSGSVGGEVGMLTIGPTARVFLMRSTGSSCVSIKKEVIR